MLDILNDSSWGQAFGFAGETGHENYEKPMKAEGARCTNEPFTREDVKKILHIREGERDGDHWLMIGKLKDKRFFYLSAGCDYTGWD